MLTIKRLLCEHLENPIGLGERIPRFSWILDSQERNVLQRSYRLMVSEDPFFGRILWDSGEVGSDESLLVPYGGSPLSPETRYFWRAMVWDNHDNFSPWSETAFFETGLWDPQNWQAAFITGEAPEDADKSDAKLLRKEFTLSGDIVSARVYATALGLYELFINGRRVGDSLLTPG